MARSIKLVLLGITPLVVGYVLNYAMLSFPISGWVINLVALGFLFLWGLLAYCVCVPGKNTMVQTVLLCSFGLLMLILVLCQELIIGQYWPGVVGFSTQMYFLPLVSFGSTILAWVFRSSTITLWLCCIIVWVCMFAVSYAGCGLKQKRK